MVAIVAGCVYDEYMKVAGVGAGTYSWGYGSRVGWGLVVLP